MLDTVVQILAVTIQGWILVLWVLVLLYRLKVSRETPLITVGNIQKNWPNETLVSVIVPARNEEKNIEKCLHSLRVQTYQNYEVVLVDDDSIDATYQRAQEVAGSDGRFRLLKLSPIERGWIGKNWACHRGFSESKGKLLLFTDADTEYDPDAISVAVHELQSKNLDILTLIPKSECRDFWSRVVLPTLSLIIMTLYSPLKVNDRKAKTAYLFGSFFLIKRDAYVRIGGHKAVKDVIVEDRALGEKAKMEGLAMEMARGEDLIRTGWNEGYVDNWQALQRIMSSSVKKNPRGGVAFAILATFMMLIPYGILSATLLSFLIAPASLFSNLMLFFSLATIILTLFVYWYEVSRVLQTNPLYTFFQLLSCIIFISALLTTARKSSKNHDFVWKGRSYG